ncbi:glycine zipper 2TM domain-containing protein [Motilimonas pumila]|uniref:Glycine zipper 2TM domain-containing protein n=1 Tax=Motilimonas pumila TaxID=2303987 RepID=A0A418YGT8_9GAMM|nr:glycine zipper 2TM domain-containing protein [Motilimonas pumila]RJG48723.1 glycine zipper 2TM domain-containing protein [Motilimonas pumila]
MKLIWLLIPIIVTCFTPVTASPYQRNVAKPVNKVAFAKVDSVRYINQQQIQQSQHQGWKTLSGAAIGGLLGYQIGDGTGQIVATAVGTLLGAGLAQQYQQPQVKDVRLVEMLLTLEQGGLVNVVQDYDANMLFKAGDAVRLLYFDDGVRVDLAY